MSIQHANRGIVKKDLQLYYNREFSKSFRGEATSNLLMNPNDGNYHQGNHHLTIVANSEIAPDGTNSAFTIFWDNVDFNYISRNFPIVNSTVYTTSVFAKAGTHNVIWVGIGNMSGGENNASFNLTTGVATNGSPASTSCSMIYYGGGWWRCITTNTSGTSGATTSAMTVSVGANRATLGTVYLWGFQAERKSYATRFLDSLNPIRNQVATNLYSADPYDGLDFVTVYNYQGSTGASFSAVVGIANPINAPNVLQYNTGTSGYQYFALTKTGLASGTYTVSYYARLASGGPSALNNAQLWRDNVSDRAMDGDPNPTIYTYWRRFRVTALVTSGTLHFFPIHNNPITGGFTVYFTGFQLESGNEPTSFSPITVSTANTITSGGGLRDISGNNVNANLTNVLFNGNGYYFNGSTTSVDTGYSILNIDPSQSFSIEVVVNFDALTSYSPSTFTISNVNTTTNVITTNVNHNLVVGDRISFYVSGGSLPSPLLDGSNIAPYYIISPTTNTFKVSTSSGGSEVDITTAGSGTITALIPNKAGMLFGRANYGGIGIYYNVSPTNVVSIWGYSRTTAGYYNTPIVAISTGITYLITVVFDELNGRIYSLYINGVSQGSASCPSSAIYNNSTVGNFSIGEGGQADGGGTLVYNPFKGSCPMQRIYRRALTAAEVLQNFNATRKTYGI